jgi:hypothetical protein
MVMIEDLLLVKVRMGVLNSYENQELLHVTLPLCSNNMDQRRKEMMKNPSFSYWKNNGVILLIISDMFGL